MAKKKIMPDENVVEKIEDNSSFKNSGKIILNDERKSYVVVETISGNISVEKKDLVGQNLKFGEVVYF